jgi:perosamine synthetase
VAADTVPLAVPSIRGNAWQYVRECLDTNWVSSAGPFVDRFEAMLAEHSGARFAVATVNGTAALHTALLVCGIGPDDAVLVPSLTFIATANAVRYTGAMPIFLDVEPHCWQLCPERLQDFLELECFARDRRLVHRETGRRVAAVMPVHALGHPVNLDPILDLARKYGLKVIEDAAEALGARYKGKPIGSVGDLTCFSFNGNKIITTGGGGMIVTDDPTLASRARYLTTQAKDDPLEYVHNEMGYNYRLTNLQAALGCAQMECLDDFVTLKRATAQRYSEAFDGTAGLTPMREAPWAFSTFWLYTALVDPVQFGMDSRALLRHLQTWRIQSRPLWQPMHRSPSFSLLPRRVCPVADHLCRHALSLPCSVGLSAVEQDRVIEAVCAAAPAARRLSA